MPSLRALECLVAIADTGSITQAARLLRLSQPAVSHQLSMLEREAQTILFLREARGLKLTPAGRAAVGDARQAIDAAASAIRSARAVSEAAGGSLRLACAQSLTVPMLAPVIRLWHRRHPDVAITLREAATIEAFLGYLDADEVDMALVPLPVPDRFTTTGVAEEEIVVAAPTDHPLARQLTVRLEDLEGAKIVHFSPDNGLSGWLDRSLSSAGIHTETVMRTSVSAAAPQLAAAGLGVAVCPVSAVSAGFPGAVRSFSPRWVRQLVAVTRTSPDPLTAQFIDALRKRGVHVSSDIRAQLADNVRTSSRPVPRRR
jgi:DNA-binding transcriptional LysR family regulator